MPNPTRTRAVAVACAGAVVAASLVPLPGGGAAGGSLGPAGADKLLHAVGYAAVAYLLARARDAGGADPATAALGAVAVAGALGGGVELLQSSVPGRTPSFADAAANLAGALVGAFAWRSRR